MRLVLRVSSREKKIIIPHSIAIQTRKSLDGIQVHLILVKSRKAPMAIMKILRLELLDCCIGAGFTSTIESEINLVEIPSTHWTDLQLLYIG
ncbi:hypothetical protein NPIL_597511 [Nephila pilipes]|uniref:Uncharacterized protein n=1 Tax=Nephila pilipes TaxID=299642 RepID=A0A8X6UCM8_NEPPI|nr:hypothetical protein NPIL_597511 [Nephila pilipes]